MVGKSEQAMNATLRGSLFSLPGPRRKRTGLLFSGPKDSFLMTLNVVFHVEIKVPDRDEEWRHLESKMSEVSFEVNDLESHDICWCWWWLVDCVNAAEFRAHHASVMQ